MRQLLTHLKTITPPRIVREGLALYGTTETAGNKSNPVILSWAKETNSKDDNWYSDDTIPWCGLFVGVIAQRAEWELPSQHLKALSWRNFGKQVGKDEAVLGDVLVFKRKGGGHVGLYIAEDTNFFYVLGGNQQNKVNIAKIEKNRLESVNRPRYKIKMPESCKKYYFTVDSPVSTNES
jgi:uncharacterized protein (TIGR02594 family)